jgi:asparagine synthetase B (glutamine-hydrolysing)
MLGPDAQQLKQSQYQAFTLRFFSSVLHLRGPDTVSQPLYNASTGDILCWNGEVFSGLDVRFGTLLWQCAHTFVEIGTLWRQ